MLSNLFPFCFAMVLSCAQVAQVPSEQIPVEPITKLPKDLKETSGLARCTETSYYVHNDSGHKPELYEIDASSGDIKREVDVRGADNKDWEELTEDSAYLYVGDFGNNAGLREDLVIYKIRKTELTDRDKVDASRIFFNYPNRSTFFFGGKHNYDCEAMIAYGDSLYLFSKNRADLWTDVYRLPKVPGTYVADHLGRFNSRGLITAADFRHDVSGELVLLGYRIIGKKYSSFLWYFSDFQGTNFFSGRQQRFEIAPNLQAEAVIFETDSTLLITNEQESEGRGRLHRVRLKH